MRTKNDRPLPVLAVLFEDVDDRPRRNDGEVVFLRVAEPSSLQAFKPSSPQKPQA